MRERLTLDLPRVLAPRLICGIWDHFDARQRPCPSLPLKGTGSPGCENKPRPSAVVQALPVGAGWARGAPRLASAQRLARCHPSVPFIPASCPRAVAVEVTAARTAAGETGVQLGPLPGATEQPQVS